jgi:hypothetical protein
MHSSYYYGTVIFLSFLLAVIEVSTCTLPITANVQPSNVGKQGPGGTGAADFSIFQGVVTFASQVPQSQRIQNATSDIVGTKDDRNWRNGTTTFSLASATTDFLRSP